jgi:hypothetical protein
MHTTKGEHMKMPIAYLDVAARYVELAPHVIFKTPTVANLGSPVGLYLEQPWVGLTEEEVSKLIDQEIGFNSCWGPEEAFAAAIEAKLKEKNT